MVYLVEDFDAHQPSSLTSLTETQIIHDFFVKQSRSAEETVDYLVGLTRMLKRWYEGAQGLVLGFGKRADECV